MSGKGVSIDSRKPILSVSKMNATMRAALRSQGFKNALVTSSGVFVRGSLVAAGVSFLREAYVATTPSATNWTKVNLLTSGLAATSGNEFELVCFARILGGDKRLDMVLPSLAIGDCVSVREADFGIDIDAPLDEYDTYKTYMKNDHIVKDSAELVYRSKSHENLGNTVTETDYWSVYTKWSSGPHAVGAIVSYEYDAGNSYYSLFRCIQAATSQNPSNMDYWEPYIKMSNEQWYFTDAFVPAENRSTS